MIDLQKKLKAVVRYEGLTLVQHSSFQSPPGLLRPRCSLWVNGHSSAIARAAKHLGFLHAGAASPDTETLPRLQSPQK